MKPEYLTMEQIDEEFMDIKAYADNRDAILSEVESGEISENEAKVSVLRLNGITQEDLVEESLEIDIKELVSSFDSGTDKRLSTLSDSVISQLSHIFGVASTAISLFKEQTKLFKDPKKTYNIKIPVEAWFVTSGYKELAEDVKNIVSVIRNTFGKDFVSSTTALRRLRITDKYEGRASVEIKKAQYEEMALVTQDALSLITIIFSDEEENDSDIPAKLSLNPTDEYADYMDALLNYGLLPLSNYATLALAVKRSFESEV